MKLRTHSRKANATTDVGQNGVTPVRSHPPLPCVGCFGNRMVLCGDAAKKCMGHLVDMKNKVCLCSGEPILPHMSGRAVLL